MRLDAAALSGRCRSRSTSPKEFAEKLKPGSTKVALRDAEGVMLAVVHVEDIWEPDREAEGKAVFGTHDTTHPAVTYLMNQKQAGLHRRPARVPAAPAPLRLQDAPPTRRTNSATSSRKRGWRQDRRLPNPQPDAPRAPRAHAPRREGGRGQPARPPGRRHDQAGRRRSLHPRPLLPGPRCRTIPPNTAMLSLLPLAMRMGGPREAIWHAHHPQEPRLHPPRRRPRPRRPRQGQRRQAVLRPVRCPGALRQSTKKSSA